MLSRTTFVTARVTGLAFLAAVAGVSALSDYTPVPVSASHFKTLSYFVAHFCHGWVGSAGSSRTPASFTRWKAMYSLRRVDDVAPDRCQSAVLALGKARVWRLSAHQHEQHRRQP